MLCVCDLSFTLTVHGIGTEDILGAFNTLDQKGADQKVLAFTTSEIPSGKNIACPSALEVKAFFWVRP